MISTFKKIPLQLGVIFYKKHYVVLIYRLLTYVSLGPEYCKMCQILSLSKVIISRICDKLEHGNDAYHLIKQHY